MVNIEYYWEQIKELDYHFAKRDGKLLSCHDCNCLKCDFDTGKCYIDKIKWLGTEHSEFTEEEIHFLKSMNIGYYLARDANGNLYSYPDRPHKKYDFWESNGYRNALNNGFLKNVHFDFIRWEDKEPYLVLELLKMAGIADKED